MIVLIKHSKQEETKMGKIITCIQRMIVLIKRNIPLFTQKRYIVKIPIFLFTTKKSADILCWFQWCRKRDLNPHDCNSHTDLNRARLPIPPFLHIKLLCCPAADKAYNTTTTFKCQHFFSVFSNAYFLYFFRKTVDIMPYFWYHFFLSETIMATHAEVSELADEQD